ncbi:formyltransferase family protein [sulfur-oxidizing endosymbiont of Gigantopelta aegis]|uniref:formyltransferase family protein n=1 Tax=sulfur-oxidizing endosymbiont of Gigantopelta aegis TaxID=2794934 RepID=UPI0018DDEBBF|nr:formyltransferase family protein [sulfur-oxidizing endosymbiont of Gigantopelta aegis]
MNIGFIGSSGSFSTLALQYLLDSEHSLSFVACDGCSNDSRFPIINDSVESLAMQYGITCINLEQPLAKVLSKLKSQVIDIILVACYGKKVPQEILALPLWGCVNLHPSLLPAFRGPVPIFWQFKEAATLGISLHTMTSHIDAGAIISQKSVSLEDGLSQQQIFSQLIQAGLPLIEQLLDDPQQALQNAQQQDERLASNMSYPIASDFAIDCAWSCQRIFNYMRASTHFQQAYSVLLNNEIVFLSRAISYQMKLPQETITLADDEIIIPCSNGFVLAQLSV